MSNHYIIPLNTTYLAIMKTQGPVGHHGGSTHNACVLLDDGTGRVPVEDVEIHNPSNGLERELARLQCNIHPVAIEEEDTMCLIVDHLQVVRIGPVEIPVEGQRRDIRRPQRIDGTWL